ncbi:hypothetical protein MNBD_GAMMA03-1706 [hydrothermal vent metagenome]|uniref:FHA domain-containing protein n=1 Tax=hydrothermal vent metagenome TaxID=652676 RepID=A0A3B0VPE1_9ZZZZ
MNLELALSKSKNYPANQMHKKQFDITGGSIGRDPKCDLVLQCDEKSISRLHAKIQYQKDNKFLICDLSTNGVFINGSEESIGNGKTLQINDGDIIKIGQFELCATINDSSRLVAKSERPVKDSIESSSITSNKVAKKKTAITLGTPSDSFTPPSVFIPDNWDSDLTLETDLTSTHEISPPNNKLHLIKQETKLMNAFLKGLEVNEDFVAEQITPETMDLIGRTLKAAIDGTMLSRENLQKTKADLCLDELTVQASKKTHTSAKHDQKATFIKGQLEAGVLGHIKTTKIFFNTLLDPHHQFQKELPDALTQNYKEVLEDQNDIYHTVKNTIEKLTEELSPDKIEAAFEYQQKIKNKNLSSIKQLSDKLTQNSNKWSFYKQSWKTFIQNAVSIAQKNFESTTILKQVTRMKNKKNAKH